MYAATTEPWVKRNHLCHTSTFSVVLVARRRCVAREELVGGVLLLLAEKSPIGSRLYSACSGLTLAARAKHDSSFEVQLVSVYVKCCVSLRCVSHN